MIKKSIIILMSFISITIFGQSQSDFIPNGYSIFDSLSFDFNGNGLLDKIIVLENVVHTDDTLYWRSMDRPFLILENLGENNFAQKVRNDFLILDRDAGGMGGEPYQCIEANDTSITFYFGARTGWFWSKTYEFSYNSEKGMWYLHTMTYSEGSMNKLEDDNNGNTIVKHFNESDIVSIVNYRTYEK